MNNEAADIYERHGPALLRKAGRMLHNREDARDLVQGLFVDLWERGQLRADLPFLYRAVTHRALNFLRDSRNRERLRQRQDVAFRPSGRVRCDDEIMHLDLLLKLAVRLKPEYVEVLVYRFVDDMSLEEVAELTGTSRKTVGKCLERIRQEVRALCAVGEGGAP